MNLFDFDGTLVDSNGVWERIDLEFLGRHGLTPTREYCDTVGRSIFPIAARFTRDYYHLDLTPQAIMDEWLDMARGEYEHHIPLKPGAAEYLAQCATRGEKMALLTACVPQLCRAALARHRLEGYFTQVIFVQEMGLEKSDPQVFLRAAAQLGTAPEACTVYDDSPSACAAARAAGMTVVGVYDPFYAVYEREMRRDCHSYISSFRSLLAH